MYYNINSHDRLTVPPYITLLLFYKLKFLQKNSFVVTVLLKLTMYSYLIEELSSMSFQKHFRNPNERNRRNNFHCKQFGCNI